MFQCPRPIVLLIALATAVIGLGEAALGQDAATFKVSGIPVDATASDAVTARQNALLAGQQEGFARLLRRLVPVGDQGRLPPAGSLPVERYVQNLQITKEQLSSTRYLAELTIAFDPIAVRELLQTHGVPFAHAVSPPLLVLPLYDDPAAPKLWREENPWWQAWEERLDRERLLRLVLPLGDLEDITALPLEQARTGDAASIARLASRYGAEDTLLMIARPVAPAPAPTPPAPSTTTPGAAAPADSVVAVTIEGYRVGTAEPVAPFTLQGQPGQPIVQVLGDAVQRLQNDLDERWKVDHLLHLDQGGFLLVDVPIKSLADWVTIDRGLTGLEQISQVDITAFARDRVQAEIHYLGDQPRLEQALATLGLGLSREGESWLLQPTVANRAPTTPPPPGRTSTPF